MSADTLFDRECYLLAGSGTPPLEATKPNFAAVETPPPLATTRESSLAPSSGDERAGLRPGRRGKTKPSQSDAVVLSQLDPNRPDIAKHALKHALDSESEAEEEDDTTPRRNRSQMTTTRTVQHNVAPTMAPALHAHLQQSLDDADDEDSDFPMIDDLPLPAKGAKQSPPKANGVHDAASAGPSTLSPPAEIKTGQKYNTRPPPLRSPGSYRKTENDKLSPGLAKLMTQPSDADPRNTLTPIQTSPPRSHCNGSPEQNTTLPSLQTALGIDSTASPFSARSPSMMRASPANLPHLGQTPSSHHYPSPFSAMSPPTTTNPATWRSNSGSASTNSDCGVTSASTLTSMSTPSSAPLQSPYHFPTPTSAPSDQPRQDALNGNQTSPDHDNPELNGLINGNGGYANGSFTCSVKGCTAVAFHTQYLLNSHMNVHSDTRPHFCPVTECPRGPGGQGFKRKNEMIR